MAKKGETKLTHTEIDARVAKCMELRTAGGVFTSEDWIKYCHKHYGDKSISAYRVYYTNSNKAYEEYWRNMLQGMLKPAMDELIILLNSNNETIKQKAIDQIIKYTGNDIQKIEAKVEGDININLTWGKEDE
jgi:hypothetical protein